MKKRDEWVRQRVNERRRVKGISAGVVAMRCVSAGGEKGRRWWAHRSAGDEVGLLFRSLLCGLASGVGGAQTNDGGHEQEGAPGQQRAVDSRRERVGQRGARGDQTPGAGGRDR